TKKIKIDCIKALVHGPERTVPICMSDERRHGIDGLSVTFNELCTKELVYQDALKNKFPIDDAVVKDNLRKTISLFGLKPGDEEHIFAQEGYSYDEGFEQFRIFYANDAMINYRVGSISVTE